jgi:hypothetical protein
VLRRNVRNTEASRELVSRLRNAMPSIEAIT